MVRILTEKTLARELFAGWEDTMVCSCLQGVMGELYVTDATAPRSAMALAAGFAFLAGEPEIAYLEWIGEHCPLEWMLLIPQNEDWSRVIRHRFGERAHRFLRYATVKDPATFDREKLRRMATPVPEGCELLAIDRQLFHLCRKENWSRDLVDNYSDYESFSRLGLGYVLIRQGELLAGASSYFSYQGGIEIEIDTREDMRRRGYARLCGARLILSALERGLYPSWDAHSLASLSLAEQLGYRLSHSYPAFEILT